MKISILFASFVSLAQCYTEPTGYDYQKPSNSFQSPSSQYSMPGAEDIEEQGSYAASNNQVPVIHGAHHRHNIHIHKHIYVHVAPPMLEKIAVKQPAVLPQENQEKPVKVYLTGPVSRPRPEPVRQMPAQQQHNIIYLDDKQEVAATYSGASPASAKMPVYHSAHSNPQQQQAVLFVQENDGPTGYAPQPTHGNKPEIYYI